jgi:hypothetical protein
MGWEASAIFRPGMGYPNQVESWRAPCGALRVAIPPFERARPGRSRSPRRQSLRLRVTYSQNATRSMAAVGNARMAWAISRMPFEGNGRDARFTKMADPAR